MPESSRRALLASAVVVVLAMLVACASGAGTAPAPVDPPVVRLGADTLVAARSLLREDATTEIQIEGTATGLIHWRSSDPTVAVVGPSGLVAARQPGTAWIVGQTGAWMDSLPLTVTDGEEKADTTIVVAHRAFGAVFPENTLPAIRRALESGARVIEVDVRFSADGHPVIIHDETVDRTTNGTGAVAGMSLAALRSLDACVKAPSPSARCQIPTLDEALKAMQFGGFILLDLKAVPTVGALDLLLTTVRQSGLQRRVMFIAFDPRLLRSIRDRDPAAALGLLTGARIPADSMRTFGRVASMPQFTSIMNTQDYYTQLRAARVDLFAWTVADTATASRLREWGVRRLISSVPLPRQP